MYIYIKSNIHIRIDTVISIRMRMIIRVINCMQEFLHMYMIFHF